MFLVTFSTSLYLYLIFRKDFKNKPNLEILDSIKPIEYLKDKKELIVSLSILFIVIIIIL
jgi:hypothetical protein